MAPLKQFNMKRGLSDKDFLGIKGDLQKHGFIVGKIVTGSMAPVIKIGDTIRIVPIEGDLKRYDIVVFWNRGKLISHYVVTSNRVGFGNERTLSTCGLSTGREDMPFDSNFLLGKVISHRIPWWTKFKLSFRTWMKNRD